MRRDGDLSTDDLARSGDSGADDRSASDSDRSRPAGSERSGEVLPSTGVQDGQEESGRPVGGETSTDTSDLTQPIEQGSVPAAEGAGSPPPRDGVQPADRAPAGEGVPPQEQAGSGAGADVALLDPADGERFRLRWVEIQTRFVDDPKDAVQTADGLVAELMQSMAQSFSEHKGRLETQWQGGGDADTEELRQALQRYRSFFNRLLST